MNVPSPFSAAADDFGTYDTYDPDRVPDPGGFLDGQDVLTGRDHLALHRLARERFEDCGVYDMTFGYNLARLNLDGRHPEAGFRYAVERDAGDVPAPGDAAVDTDRVLRAEFTPTTEFCPQSDTLAKGAFRAFNGDTARHEYDLVRVRVDEMHQKSGIVNRQLRDLETRYLESGTLPDPRADPTGVDEGVPDEAGYEREPGTPF